MERTFKMEIQLHSRFHRKSNKLHVFHYAKGLPANGPRAISVCVGGGGDRKPWSTHSPLILCMNGVCWIQNSVILSLTQETHSCKTSNCYYLL